MSTTTRIAGLIAGRVHYAWVVTGLMFVVILSIVGVRAAPAVLMVPLETAFGWSRDTVSAAISLNILLFGLIGPFAAALIQTIGLKRTILLSLSILCVTMLLASVISSPWQLFATWGLMVGVGCGAGTVGLATAIANRWFVERRGLAVGLLTASNASGQLVFLPLLATVVEHGGWRGVSLLLAAVMAALIPLVMIALPESPRAVGLGPYGAPLEQTPGARAGNPVLVAFGGLARGIRSLDFWLLFSSFAVCGFSTNGLVGTHLIAYCVDHGIPEVSAAGILAAIGVFDLIGTTLSGWLTDRFNSRVLLFWYYGLRGLSLIALPFTNFDVVSLSVFAVFYGLDWIATVPPTVRIANEAFGDKNGPLVFGWVVAGHQLGAACAAFFAGFMRSAEGNYLEAFMIAGATGIVAAMLSLMITRRPTQPVLAAA
ncbi:MAG: MFS transporter [Acetobacteraceae bacterium]|nr:MFS transporter [Acetobacteraceae bacterium]